ncbi:hypothetical protein [Nonomuraea sp. NPDC003804]|uniref:hypothetical protein n=1 Tax=Nonomuraea sp. NPDC003804 TaxID=3154547 RepID=UPI0033B61DC4
MTALTETAQQAASGVAAPEDWRVLADRVANFAPEDDTALITFMQGETAGVLAYADALEQARENCVNDVGLDPAAVQGLTTSSEHVSEVSERLAEALKEFLTVYSEVLELRANGVTLPFDGRWFTGETA